MTELVSRAASLVEEFERQYPEEIRLAETLSLAVRVEPELLRKARLTLHPGVGAGAEADLWFSPLVESSSARGFVFAPDVQQVLRERLKRDPDRLRAAWELLQQFHPFTPRAVVLEEQVTWLSLSEGAAATPKVDRLLGQAVRAMVSSAERALGIARWAVGALPRLPKEARDTEAAAVLAIGVAARVGAQELQRTGTLPRRIPLSARRVLPTALERVTVRLRREPGSLVFVGPDEEGFVHELQVPATTPILLIMEWTEAQGVQQRLLVAEPRTREMLPMEVSRLRLIALDGTSWELSSRPGAVRAQHLRAESGPVQKQKPVGTRWQEKQRLPSPAQFPGDVLDRGFGNRDAGRGRIGSGRGRGRDEGPLAPGQRVIVELSILEKALSRNDFAAQKAPLEAIVQGLRPMRLKSLDDLDINTRGRLITTLLRVQRQPKPPTPKALGEPGGWPAAAGEGVPAAQAAATPQAPAEDAGIGRGVAPAAPPVDFELERYDAYKDVMYLVGQAWRAAGDHERAAVAFAVSGRQPGPESEEPVLAEGELRERPGRSERRERRERSELEPPPELTGDWFEQAKQLEAMGRTRDAGRLHERNNSFAEAARLFEAGRDVTSALRCAVQAGDLKMARRLISGVPANQVAPMLEKAGAYELLMEHYVGNADFENAARLYERARQYDQAALAYERANKLTLARKSYERARDFANANRVLGLEVKSLVERGDRLGAATLLVAAGQRREAVGVLSPLPAPKAFHFMQRLKLDEEARALAQKELARADEEKNPAVRARWLELLGETAAAAEAWEQAGRKEKALPLHEQLGNLTRAAQLAEELQQRDKAIDLYTRLNDAAGLRRARALPRTPLPAAAAAQPESEDAEDSLERRSVKEQGSE